jgi:hypothetical protein
MPCWTDDELRHIAAAEELQIAPVRRNGQLRRPTTIWAVRAGDDADQAVLDQVDAAYRQKYGGRYAGIVDSITDAEHRATTLRLTPQQAR